MRAAFAGFVMLLAVVFGRLIHLEVTQGAAFRDEAAKPLEQEHPMPGVRGRILAADGSVLACDKEARALAVHYRWIEEPADPGWLRWMARRRLTAAGRRDEQQLAAAEAEILSERRAMAEQLIRLTGISAQQWNERAERIRSRVKHIHDSVNQRRREIGDRQAIADRDARLASKSFWAYLQVAVDEIFRPFSEPDRFEPVRVAEEYDYHVMIDHVTVEIVAAIEGSPEKFPAVQLVTQQRRIYPHGSLAAHILGYLGVVGREELQQKATGDAYRPEEWVGRTGLELAYEKALRGQPGVAVERTNRSGQVLSTYRRRAPTIGRDLLLTLDLPLQRAAEMLLTQALQRRQNCLPMAELAGGAILVLDAHTGAVLAAASAPTFDPNAFAEGSPSAAVKLLKGPGNPLFNRSIQMAIPPGSVFKIVTAAALLQEGALRPGEPMHCRGYLRSPDRLRCAIYRQDGVGHGDVTLSDALCASCNVYFFHHAGHLGWGSIADWAWRFGFGRRTGIDLPQEVSGRLPMPQRVRDGSIDQTAELRSVGQGDLNATPIQIARMIAAVANGGRLITPHIVRGYGLPADDTASAPAGSREEDRIGLSPAEPIEGLTPAVLSTIREGLLRTVVDPQGTAYDGDSPPGLSWAGKTGTAETGIVGQEHAWFAGYVPAERPRIAMVVVLEHAGNATAAAAVAKRVVMQLSESANR